MKLILEFWSGSEYEGGTETIPFEYSSMEDAEYDFLALYDECRKNLEWINEWTKANYPVTFHKTDRYEAMNAYLAKWREVYDTTKHSGTFKFLDQPFDCHMDFAEYTFFTLDDWFEQNKLR